ncbi:MAG: hypothetical protein AA931_09685 [Peptococcaceae bacterium 1109]|nr:MAG: hypothetical protein AA931_09685 [Peptococcaceae bacterium 1109]
MVECRLLVADDEKYLREKVSSNVDWQKYNCQVFQAKDGYEALTILKEENIDILVTDIRMPGMTGIELIRRAREQNPGLRVIVISEYADFEYARESLRLGVEDYVLKPFRTQRLLEMVQRLRAKIAQERDVDDDAREAAHDEMYEAISRSSLPGAFRWLINRELFVEQSTASACRKLGSLLKAGNEGDLEAELHSYFQLMDQFQEDTRSVYIFMNSIMIALLNTLKEVGFAYDEGVSIMVRHISAHPEQNGSLAMLKEWLKAVVLDTNRLIQSAPQRRKTRMMHQIKQYVDENYQRGISLGKLAEEFNVSTGYLSKLFLDQVGQHFSDYINGLKVRKAMELLKTTDQRMYEIADFLGFQNAYYFSSWFKREVGVTPTEYRADPGSAQARKN